MSLLQPYVNRMYELQITVLHKTYFSFAPYLDSWCLGGHYRRSSFSGKLKHISKNATHPDGTSHFDRVNWGVQIRHRISFWRNAMNVYSLVKELKSFHLACSCCEEIICKMMPHVFDWFRASNKEAIRVTIGELDTEKEAAMDITEIKADPLSELKL